MMNAVKVMSAPNAKVGILLSIINAKNHAHIFNKIAYLVIKIINALLACHLMIYLKDNVWRIVLKEVA